MWFSLPTSFLNFNFFAFFCDYCTLWHFGKISMCCLFVSCEPKVINLTQDPLPKNCLESSKYCHVKLFEILQIRTMRKNRILNLQISNCRQNLIPLWSIGLMVRVLDSQPRGPRLKTTGWLSLSSFQGQLNEHQDPLGT